MKKIQNTEVPSGFALLQRHNGEACYAACMDSSQFHGWLMWKNLDGQWVSKRKLADWEALQVEDQWDANIVHETTGASLHQFKLATAPATARPPAAGSIADDPEFKKLGAILLTAIFNDNRLDALNELARYIDTKLKGSTESRDAARWRYVKKTTTAIRNSETGVREECSPDQFEKSVDNLIAREKAQ